MFGRIVRTRKSEAICTLLCVVTANTRTQVFTVKGRKVLKFRLIAIGISVAVMLSAVACDKKDANLAASVPETFAESVSEDVSEAGTKTVSEGVTEADAAANAAGVSEIEPAGGSTETGTAGEVTIEIVTGRNTPQKLAANETVDSFASTAIVQEPTALTETVATEQTTAAETKTLGTAAAAVAPKTEAAAVTQSKNGYADGAKIGLNSAWKYADFSVINSGTATMYLAKSNRKDKIIGINAGHGTSGGTSVKTWCHPDKTPKVTGGTTYAGATQAVAVSTGMSFSDGTKEAAVTLKESQLVKDLLLERGYDVLMIRDGEDVQLDNVARTVICNNVADCHIAIHWDGDGLGYDKGCFYMSVPDGIKYLDSVAATWQSSEALGASLIAGLKGRGCKIFGDGTMDMDLTQTSYSTVPSIDIELGNQSSDHSDAALQTLALGIADGVESFFG